MQQQTSKTAKQILAWLGSMVIEFSDSMESVKGKKYIMTAVRHQRLRDWQTFNEDRNTKLSINRLRRKKWIKDQLESEQFTITMHQDAIVSCLKQAIIVCEERLPKGKILLVIFDIPNGANKARVTWRRFLKKAGFHPLQLSVWTTDKNVGHALHLLGHILKMEKWLKIVIADEWELLNQ